MICAEREELKRKLIWIQQASRELRENLSGYQSSLSWDHPSDVAVESEDLLGVADTEQCLQFLTEWRPIVEAEIKLHELTCARCRPAGDVPQGPETPVVAGLCNLISHWEREESPQWAEIIERWGYVPSVFLSQQQNRPDPSSSKESSNLETESLNLPDVKSKNDAVLVSQWEQIEITFLSDERIEVSIGRLRTALNYAEFGLEDRRTHTPNRAWLTLRVLAENRGILSEAKGRERNWPTVEKRMQEIRKALRAHFRLDSDPLPFDPGIGYRALFKIAVSPSMKS